MSPEPIRAGGMVWDPADERWVDEPVASGNAKPAPPDVTRMVRASLSGPAILMHEFPRPASLLGEGIVTVGDLVLVFGGAGIGKTWLALTWALALARAEAWFGMTTTTEPVDVGFLELEIHGHAVQDRLRDLVDDVPNTFHLVVRPQLRGAVDLVDADGRPRHLEELRAWIREKRLRVVFVDALARATSCPQIDFSPLLLALDALRGDTGCAIVLLHHEGKRGRDNGDVDDLDAMRGDSRLSGFPQAVLRVLWHHGARCIRFAKASCAATPAPIYYQLGEDGVPSRIEAPEQKQREKGAESRERVFDVVRTADPFSVSCSEVAQAVKLTDSPTRAHLAALVKAKRIVTVGDGKALRYRLPPVAACEAVQAEAFTSEHNGL